MSKIRKTDDGELLLVKKELIHLMEEKQKLALELSTARKELAFQKEEKGKRAAELGIANKELVFQDGEKEKRAAELGIANIELAFQDEEKGKRAAELGIANKELAFQGGEKQKRAAELGIANKELAFESEEKEKRAAELIVANKELIYQNEEKEKRAAELGIANTELSYQNDEKEKRAAELIIANKELVYQNDEKEKRAAELIIANKELVFQNAEKEKRAAELIIANEELLFQNEEKEKRAAELIIANDELAFQNEEKEKRAAELIVANYARSLIEASLDPLVTINAAGKITDVNEALIKVTGASRKDLIDTDFSSYFTDPEKAAEGYRQVFEKGFVADYALTIKHKNGTLTDVLYNASVYKDNKGNVLGVFAAARDVTEQKWAIDLRIANKELAFQNDEKEKRAAELIIANEELVFQNEEKEKRAAELDIANKELLFQNNEKEKRAAELIIANKELVFQNAEKEKRAAELNIANVELAFQNGEKEKRAAEKERRAAELIIANAELVFQNGEKEKRAAELEEKNREVEAARSDIERKTKQLEVSSKYKSEFLANMSHELRTPLNSLLILSKDLSENRKKNLTDDQVESAEIIYKSGYDLLILINEVLDLSKIEAGKMSINVEPVNLKDFMGDLIRGFKHNSEQKGLKLNTNLDIELPEFILTDEQRLKQILKNLISNAIKFTDKGSVTISLGRHSDKSVIIAVADTGIGIQESNQMAIFEAFQQADGTTSRKYGGTGLGLSISRELAKLIGGEITLSSEFNEGSTFSLILPIEVLQDMNHAIQNTVPELKKSGIVTPSLPINSKYVNYPTINDDRNSITPEDKVVLIVEDDVKFLEVLLKLSNNRGFKCLCATTGEDGFLMARKYNPHAIILDVGLPGMKGDKLLQKLKSESDLSHIPVHIVSGNEESKKYLHDGAIEFLMKPVRKEDMESAFDRIERFMSRKIKNLLIVEDDQNSRKALKVLIGDNEVNYLEAENGTTALSLYSSNEIDCIILDLDLPDMNGIDFIHKLEDFKGHNIPQIIIYTGMDLTSEEKINLNKYTKNIIQKGVESEVELLRDTDLFLHRAASRLKPSSSLNYTEPVDEATFFLNKKILLVDDDYRNVFALAKILTDRGMEIIKAENGIVALEKLKKHDGIELVLMDIMMPEMDGYEATRRIRAQKKFLDLPVIAVTAKAMNYDKQKCIDAGANEYITKPVEIEQLMLMMRELLENKNKA